MSKESLQDIIENFDPEKFIRFFREKNRSFAPRREDLPQYEDDNFSSGIKLGEIQFAQDEKMLICTFQANQPLSERSGKKAQYEKGKKVLKEANADGGIFIFYDRDGRFRFSLIYPEYTGKKREWSYFKRFTYFVSPELTNKTFRQQIGEGDFSTLQKIKDAFSVDPVTKQFYGELQGWYFWAMDRIQFPDDYKYSSVPAKDREIRNATNLIRLITRIIFIWFLTEKGLVPPGLFSRNKLGNIVKDFMKDEVASNFYNAILQNLFFGTLNQMMDERKFADERGYPANKKEYGVKNLYRYGNKFLISKEEVLALFKEIPFLNGGLFDCLDKEDESGKVIYVDGFSRNPAKQTIIPDYLFFQQEDKRVDLSLYGIGANRPVRGLIEILNSYNFTIDENTPVDQEIALDPELLGKVFENLLASYNPETATTARKATGSYYTPREIVDYMVGESLVAYLTTGLDRHPLARSSHSRDSGDPEPRLRHLLSYTDEPHQFSPPEVETIITDIDNIKILDPACGSGAFPMGILHKLVHALQKLDPENKYWHELQYQKAIKESEEVFKEGDKNQRQEMLKEINETFDEGINYPDYARKLYLIENCIYGVDIQPIAIQISKLRFFISLVLDQKVDMSKENLGIRALPNLETKFVAANTLIGLEMPRHIFYTDKIKKLEDEIKSLRHKYFQAKTRREKLDCQKKDRELRGLLAEELKGIGFSSDSSEKIAAFDLYDQNASVDFFDPEWMFGITTHQYPPSQGGKAEGMAGFDIVIANPPYIRHESIKALKPQLAGEFDKFYCGTADLYTYFYKKGIDLLKTGGHLCFIAPNKFMRAGYGRNTRRLLTTQATPKIIIDFCELPVFEAGTDPAIVLVVKNSPSTDVKLTAAIIKSVEEIDRVSEVVHLRGFLMQHSGLSIDGWTLDPRNVTALMDKLLKAGKPLGEYVQGKFYYGIKTGLNEAFVIDAEARRQLIAEDPKSEELIKPWLRGRDIKKWKAEWAGLYVLNIASSANKQWPWSNEKTEAKARKIFSNTYPAVHQHLSHWEAKLKKRDDQGRFWWELRSCAYYEEFERSKIIYADIALLLRASYDNSGALCANTLYILPTNDLSLMAILHSRLFDWFARHKFQCLGDPWSGGRLRFIAQYMESFPVVYASDAQKAPIIRHVENILSAPDSPEVPRLEAEINRLVYTLYGLTPEEIEIVGRKG